MWSFIKSVLVMFAILAVPHWAMADPVTFETTDGFEISGDIEFPEYSSRPRPAVIFIHQGGSDKSEWIETDLYKWVVDKGMVAFSYDVRGHGQSEGRFNRELFDDPDRAPKDLKAALHFLASQDNIDINRIGIVGSSIGANLAMVGVSHPEFNVQTAVAISGKTSAWLNLAGTAEPLEQPKSVYLIAGEDEQGGKRGEWAKEMYDMASDPKKLEIVSGSGAHGTKLFKDAPKLQTRICMWLEGRLNP